MINLFIGVIIGVFVGVIVMKKLHSHKDLNYGTVVIQDDEDNPMKPYIFLSLNVSVDTLLETDEVIFKVEHNTFASHE